MTIEQAVERVEAVITDTDINKRVGPVYVEALRLVLERAKEPRVYALEEDERAFLRDMAVERADYVRYEWPGMRAATQAEIEARDEKSRALAAALALEKPEEPFTVGEWEAFDSALADQESEFGIDRWSLRTKLRAYIEGRQPPKLNSSGNSVDSSNRS